MRIAHWSLTNGSGLHNLARDIALAECVLGLDSFLIDSSNYDLDVLGDVDCHVIHSHIPDSIRVKARKIVYCIHGTAEHCFQTSVEMGLNGGYGASDPWMMAQYYLKTCDAIVTWWPRAQAIWQSLCDKSTKVHYVPMGVDKSFWTPQQTRGKWAGSPTLLTAENCHYIKWPLDLFFIWPWVTAQIPDAVLHAQYLPRDQHRWFMPLVNSNGAAYKSYISAQPLLASDLRNAFCSTDYYIGLVRYGDYNRVCLEAKASGAKIISYRGNEFADYWITEGDQRPMAKELTAILNGEMGPRLTPSVPDISETAQGMKEIYESIS